MDDGWRKHLLESDEQIAQLLTKPGRVAVLGIKTEAQRGQPAFSVAEALQSEGWDVVPVPTYYPDVTQILGKPVFRKVDAVPGPIDIVDVFRRPQDVAAHLPELLAAKPRAVWLQLGIRHDATAEALARAGIDVVQDRCLIVEWRRLGGRG